MRTPPHTWVRVLLGLLAAGLLAGCPSRGIPSYDPCERGQRCEGARDRCVEIVYPGPMGTGMASMCTLQGCLDDTDCALDVRAQPGACLGFDAALRTCFERCARAGDCALGWSCRALAPTPGESIDVCVPDPPSS